MIRQKNLLILFALAALVGCLASPALAERVQTRYAQGNNVGLGIRLGWGMPFRTQTQFPKGSGNFITNDVYTIGVASVRDFDGDGVPEDTILLGSGIRDQMAGYCSIEGYDVLAPLAATGANMEGTPATLEYAYIWSSYDKENLADWPIEGRNPKTASGTPEITQSGETIFFHSGDVFNSWAGPPSGFYMGWSLQFLNFGESNNMVYGHIHMENVTEYMKWNPSSSYKEKGDLFPNGWNWSSLCLINNQRAVRFAGGACNYMYHPAMKIVGAFYPEPTVSGFTPAEPPLWFFQMTNLPRSGDQEMDLTAVHAASGDEFGISGPSNLFASGLSKGKRYRAILLLEDLYPGQVSPWNDKPFYGWPGLLTEEDTRYNQWIWGASWDTYACYGEMHDIAPRDSIVMDFTLGYPYPGVQPMITPVREVANMDDAGMQDAFASAEHYATVAKIVINSGFKVPSTPLPPPMTIIPGDREVSITWSDVNLQTPDPYYYFLQEEGLDPNGSYKEYDMEGYRLYRSFVGPNDSHSELIGDFSKGGGNLQFFFVDKMEDDRDYGYRMKNGMKVWYALVPYDKNTDPATGASFSLPDPTSGKLWNKPGDRLYQVIPRSEASNFRAASLIGVTYEGGATVSLHSIDLAGDGSGNLLEAPQWLEPNVGEITFTPVNNEKISSDKIIYVECNYMGGDGGGCADRRQYATRKFKLVEGSQEVLAPARIRTHGSDVQTIDFSGPVDDAGVSYALSVPFQGLYSLADYRRAWHRSIDLGTYPGRVINFTSMGCGYDHDLGGSTRRPGTSPSMLSYMKNGRFTVTWKAAGSDMTLEVKDLSRGITMSAVDYPDEDGWGFMTVEGYGAEIAARRVNGTYYDEAFRYYTPKADRTVKMLDKIPADYPSKFGFWLNGLVWKVIDGMPADGTVMTIDNAYGSWNGDQTVFTQVADMPWMGEKWRIDVKASTLDPEDANLSKIRVVPNPYLATSFLDLSPQSRRIEFVNLPNRCTIRIFSLGGNLVNVLNHIGVNRQGWGDYVDVDRFVKSVAPVYTGYDNHGGTEGWNLRNRFGQTVASGLYFFHVTDQRGETHTGKFYIVN